MAYYSLLKRRARKGNWDIRHDQHICVWADDLECSMTSSSTPEPFVCLVTSDKTQVEDRERPA